MGDAPLLMAPAHLTPLHLGGRTVRVCAAAAQGRHPVMERLCGEGLFQANDTYMSDCGSLHIITGWAGGLGGGRVATMA